MRSVKNKGGNTSNLIQHLRRIHPTQYATMTPPGRKPGASQTTNDSSTVSSETQPTVKRLFANNVPLTSGNKRHINAVSRPGFQKLLNVLEPRYKVMNKTTFSKNKVVKLYDTTKEAVMQDLNSVDFFASTADMWSSHGLTPYMGHTLNWIDSEWNLRCRNLGTKFVPQDHIPLNNWAKFTMNDMFVHWKLNAGKQIAITTDN